MNAPEHFDVVVVGAGSSGATLAARLTERADRRVLLLDSGPDRPPHTAGHAAGVDRVPGRDPDRLPGDSDSRVTATPVETGASGVRTQFLRGRMVGGSSALNGAYFVRPTRADLDGWAAAGHDRWSFQQLLPALRRLESDLDLGGTELHGAAGPIPVQRHKAPLHPLTAAFFGACEAAGHPEHVDLNDGGDRGWGPVPRNVDHGGRVDTAMAYLDPVRDRPNLTIRGGWAVSDLLVDRGRVVGVQRRGPSGADEVVRADQVVLCAGALGSPVLVERAFAAMDERVTSRVRRSRELSAATTLTDVDPFVSLHPAVDLYFEPVDSIDLDAAPLVQGALHHLLDSGATAEVLAICRPYGRATGVAPQDRSLSLRVSLMTARTLARRHAGSAGGWLELRGPDRWHPQDRADLREAVRSVATFATSAPLAAVITSWHGPSPSELSSDASLDRWISQRVVVSMHAAGSATMGPAGDPGAVVDQLGRVHGVDGVRIADTSILPALPSRGPACMAIAIAEHLAPTFD